MTEPAPTLIADIEARIEDLTDRRQRTGKAILLARAAMWLGVALLLLVFGGYILSNRLEIGVMAFSAALGGVVFGGSSRATSEQLATEISRLERDRREAIDALELEFVQIAPEGPRVLH